MNIKIGYGKGKLNLEVPDKNLQEVLVPNKIKTDLIGKALIEQSLEHPIGTDRLERIVSPGNKIVIITSDITRPVPSYKIIPPILSKLKLAGIKNENIPILTGELLELQNGILKFVALDGYRLAVRQGFIDNSISLKEVVPERTLSELYRITS